MCTAPAPIIGAEQSGARTKQVLCNQQLAVVCDKPQRQPEPSLHAHTQRKQTHTEQLYKIFTINSRNCRITCLSKEARWFGPTDIWTLLPRLSPSNAFLLLHSSLCVPTPHACLLSSHSFLLIPLEDCRTCGKTGIFVQNVFPVHRSLHCNHST